MKAALIYCTVYAGLEFPNVIIQSMEIKQNVISCAAAILKVHRPTVIEGGDAFLTAEFEIMRPCSWIGRRICVEVRGS